MKFKQYYAHPLIGVKYYSQETKRHRDIIRLKKIEKDLHSQINSKPQEQPSNQKKQLKP